MIQRKQEVVFKIRRKLKVTFQIRIISQEPEVCTRFRIFNHAALGVEPVGVEFCIGLILRLRDIERLIIESAALIPHHIFLINGFSHFNVISKDRFGNLRDGLHIKPFRITILIFRPEIHTVCFNMGHGIGRTVNLSRTHFNISAEQLNVIALHEPGIAQIARDRNICALCLLSIRIVLLREIPHIVVSLIQGISLRFAPQHL